MMFRKLFVLTAFVLALCLVGVGRGATESVRKCWWSDWGTTHDWNEPNNWYTMDHYWEDSDGDGARDYGETMWFVKVDPNQVPDYNIPAKVGKAGAREVYPRALRDYVLGGGPMTDPTIGPGMVAEANYVQVGGGESFDPNVGGGAEDPDPNHDDPNRSHYLWMTGGTLDVGAPQTWEGYEVEYGYGEFNGQWATGRFSLAVVPSGTGGPGYGTFYMSGGTVNLGGHMEVAAWGATGLLDMTGGTINMVQGLYCPSSIWGGTPGTINLHGGAINARFYKVAGESGSLDITEGKLTLEGDETGTMSNYAGGGVANASVTVYGVGHGEIVSDPCYGDAVDKRAALSIDYDSATEGRTTVSASVTDPEQAWAPNPPDGALSVKGPPSDLPRPILSWSAGDGAGTHDVYFGTSFAEVNDADTSSGAYIGDQGVGDVNWTVDRDLEILTQYFWRIDEVNVGPVKGEVWDFTVANLGKSSYPSPSNGEEAVATDTVLSWAPGIYAVTHDVYFGTSFDDVNDATTSYDPNGVFMGNQSGNTYDVKDYDPNALVFSTTYYWRIDDVNGASTYWGDVWRFTTGAYLTVEDFDSYATNTELYEVWDDYWTNESGSEIYVEKEPTFVREGNSVKFDYLNTYTSYGKQLGSFIDADIADLAIGSDWTVSEAKALVLYFFGKLGNSATVNDKMWVELEDTSNNAGLAIYDGDLNDIAVPGWHEWNIDLGVFDACGVSLANVDKIHIGFGNYYRTGQAEAGGAGTVWFDDIGLYPRRCVGPAAYHYGDLTGDCMIDYFDVEVMAADWLAHDYNTIGFDATLKNYDDPNSSWTTNGHDGNALLIMPAPEDLETFCADESGQVLPYVEIPPLNLNSNTVTMSAWVKRDGDQCDWMTGIIFQRDGDTTAGLCFGNKDVARNDLAFNWDDMQDAWNWDTGLVTPNQQWFFAALVVEPDQGTIYLYDGTWSSNTKTTTQGFAPEPFAGVTCIGQDMHRQPRNVIGWIDDARIYNYSLSQSEIESIVTTGEPNDPYCWYKLDEGGGLIAHDSGSGGMIYHPVPSAANYVDDEPEYHRYVNFKDYDYLARNWLKEVLFP